MGVLYPALRAIDVTRLSDALQSWDRLTRDFNGQITDYGKSVQAPVNDEASWTGAAASAARKKVARYQNKLVATGAYLGTVGDTLQQAVEGVTAAQQRLEQALKTASSVGASVDENGRVSLDGTASFVDWDHPPVEAAMQAQHMINQAIHMANLVDEEVSPLFDFATKFGQHGEGPWLTDMHADVRTAQQLGDRLGDRLAGFPTHEVLRHDTPAQSYAVSWPNVRDVILKEAFQELAIPYFIYKGWCHAAVMFQNWLDNTGMTVHINPEDLMNDVPKFKQLVEHEVTGYGHFNSKWQNTDTEDDANHPQSMDWYYAMNDFRWRVVGRTVPLMNGTLQIDYTVGIRKPYVFGPPRQPIQIPGLTKLTKLAGLHDRVIPQEYIAHLHSAGLAKNFIIQGISHHSRTIAGRAGPQTARLLRSPG